MKYCANDCEFMVATIFNWRAVKQEEYKFTHYKYGSELIKYNEPINCLNRHIAQTNGNSSYLQ